MVKRAAWKSLPSILMALVLGASLSPQSAQGNELKVWDQLKGTNPKGYVLLMRHALAPGVGDPANFNVNDCSTQRNLSDEGRQDAADIGQWLQRREVKILRVESSRWCRAKETAKLLDIGKVRLNRNLDSLFQASDLINHPQTVNIKKRIVSHRNTSGLLIFVGHSVNIQAAVGVSLESGQGVLVKANTRGEIKVMGYSPTP
jgi:phosphohistidine phosphatase SixA